MKLCLRDYIRYKFLNSLFLGVSVGSIFVLYTPIQPSLYSLGGITLAVGMLFVAKWYELLMNLRVFFYITVFVESVVLVFVLFFLVFGYSYMSAVTVYLGYQVTFMFGGYLLRMETIALRRTAVLSFADVAKHKGYLVGMVISYGFYELLGYLGVLDKRVQVYGLYFGLLGLQVFVLFFVFRAFEGVGVVSEE